MDSVSHAERRARRAVIVCGGQLGISLASRELVRFRFDGLKVQWS